MQADQVRNKTRTQTLGVKHKVRQQRQLGLNTPGLIWEQESQAQMKLIRMKIETKTSIQEHGNNNIKDKLIIRTEK